MGETGHAVIERGARCVIAGIGVAGGDDHARARQLAIISGAGGFRRQGHQGLPDLQRRQKLKRPLVGAAEFAGIVDALARGAEERSFDVDAQHAGHAGFDRPAHRLDRRVLTFARSSLIRVGRKPVVPNARCAAANLSMVSILARH